MHLIYYWKYRTISWWYFILFEFLHFKNWDGDSFPLDDVWTLASRLYCIILSNTASDNHICATILQHLDFQLHAGFFIHCLRQVYLQMYLEFFLTAPKVISGYEIHILSFPLKADEEKSH